MRKNTDPHRPLTTTLPEPLLRELDCAAKELGRRKNEILIEAFTWWNKQRKQALLAEKHAKREEH
jgi:hypothetical protein